MAGLTADALGVAVLKVKGVDDLEPLRKALSQKPWRRIFVQHTEDPDQPDGYQLCVGTQCLEPQLDLSAALVRL